MGEVMVNHVKVDEAQTIKDYLDTVEKVSKMFDGINIDLLEKALEGVYDDHYGSDAQKIQTRYYKFSSIKSLSRVVKSIKETLKIVKNLLTGSSGFKTDWEPRVPFAEDYVGVSLHTTSRSGRTKKWITYCDIINKASEAVEVYLQDIEYNYSLKRELSQIIKSGDLFKETVRDLNEICNSIDGRKEHRMTTLGSGNILVYFAKEDLKKTGFTVAKDVKNKIKSIMKSKSEDYPEIEFIRYEKEDTEWYVAMFKVQLEKMPKLDIMPRNEEVVLRKCISVNEGIPTFPSQFKPAKRDIQKMTEYFNKGSNPKTLANTVKDTEKSLSRYYISVATGWDECAKEFYRRSIELGIDKSYIDELKEKALKDKSISIGDTSNLSSKSGSVSKPSGNTPKPQKRAGSRKTIDANTGFLMTGGDDSTPFS